MTATQFNGDFRQIGTLDGREPVVMEFDVKAGAATSIEDGDLVIVDGSNAGYVKKAADGAASTAEWIGLAVKDSTDTASADGVVKVALSPVGLIVRGLATTPGNFAQAIKNTRVTLDVSTGVQKVDENDTVNGVLRVLDYNTTDSTIDVVVPCHLAFVS